MNKIKVPAASPFSACPEPPQCRLGGDRICNQVVCKLVTPQVDFQQKSRECSLNWKAIYEYLLGCRPGSLLWPESLCCEYILPLHLLKLQDVDFSSAKQHGDVS